MRGRSSQLSFPGLGVDILVAAVSVFVCVTFGGWIDALMVGDGPGVQRVLPSELKQVRLLEGPLKQATERDQKYLRGLELDRLFHNFRVTAGLPSNGKPLGGWESPTTELRGHFLSACAMMYASFDDRVLKAKADTVVAALAKCQEALGNGYLSAFPEEFIDRVETGKRVWAPWYTLHKILAGLLDMYTLADHVDRLKGLHVNTHIPPRTRPAAQVGKSSGGADPYHLATQLGSSNQESCTSYNMLKLTSHLFTWDPDPTFADYYELLFFNGILPTQNPSDGMLMYYLPFASGWYKTFGTPRNSFWCCTGTGVESFARLGSDIYYHGKNDLYVNLFLPSEVRWNEKGVTLRQETDFPRSPRTQLLFRTSKAVSFSLHIRVPEWSADGARVRLNGRDLGVTSSPRSYLVLTRTWRDGDRVDVEYSMDLHLKALPDDRGVAAIMYGPVVLAGKLGSEGVANSLIHGFYGPSRPPVLTPSLVVTNPDVHSWVVPVSGRTLTFRTKGVGVPHDVELMPLHDLFDERYAVYWRICDKVEWEEAQKQSEMMIGQVVDNVSPGDSKSVEAHTLAGAGVDSGNDAGMGWVRTRDWVLYSLKVLLNRPVQLKCIWAKSDTARAYTIRVDGVRLALKPEVVQLPNGFVEERYGLPLATTFGRRSVAVTFEVAGGGPGKKLFGCSIIGSAAKGD